MPIPSSGFTPVSLILLEAYINRVVYNIKTCNTCNNLIKWSQLISASRLGCDLSLSDLGDSVFLVIAV